MRLQCLAGAYAGQVLDYGPSAGLAALKVGTAVRVGDVGPVQHAPAEPRMAASAPSTAVRPIGKKRSR